MILRPPLDPGTLAALVDQLADAVVVSDVDGTIVYWNRTAEKVFGWTADQAVGRSLDLIVPERQRNAHWEGYQRVMEQGESRYGDELLRVPSLHADGQRRSIAFTVTILANADGSVAGIAAVIRDETERWRDEQELRRRLRTAETG